MIFIYSSHLSSRLEYIAEHLFKNILGVDFILSDDKQAFLNHQGTCINYSSENLSSEKLNQVLQIVPFGLLEEKGINPHIQIDGFYWDELFCFFPNPQGDIPFDIFSASFYLLTSYEEYGTAKSDIHSRFPHEESLAYRSGFLDIPLIDRWAHKFKELLIGKFGGEENYSPRQYRFVSTFDIDYPYLYRNKGLVKNAGGALRDLLKKKYTDFSERLKVVLHLKRDPYFQAVCWIDDFHKKHEKSYYFFILLSKYGKYGRKTIYPHRTFFSYLKKLKNVKIGIHPSYESFLDKNIVDKEKQKLEKKLGKEISETRQHFLRIRFPESFSVLDELKFSEDFSLSFAKSPGFRSGTAIPYHFYDLNKDIRSGLLIRPTILMDTCLMLHQNLMPEDALPKIKQYALECKKSGGDFVMIWHNNNLSGTPEKNPWLNTFIRSFEYAFSLENGNFEAEKDYK